jgi:hypothetical protein
MSIKRLKMWILGLEASRGTLTCLLDRREISGPKRDAAVFLWPSVCITTRPNPRSQELGCEWLAV